MGSESSEYLYAPFYCEENVWHLAGDSRVLEGAQRGADVVLVSNEQRACAFWSQRASESAEQPVVWDYHVVLLTHGDESSPRVWDLDSREGCPIALDDYLKATFRSLPEELSSFAPRFRLVEAQKYRRSFSSDRAHMRRADGGWLHAPPRWPAIVRAGETSFLAWTRIADGDGDVSTLQQLAARTW